MDMAQHRVPRLVAALAACLLAMYTRPVVAQSYWQVQSGDWSAASNWSAGVPSSSTWAWIVNGGTAGVTQTGGTCNWLSLGGTAGSGSVEMTAGGFSANTEFVGHSGPGAFAQSGGTNSASNGLELGFVSGASGAYILSGASLLLAGGEQIGNVSGATALFQQSGGSNTATSLSIGTGGCYELEGGTLQVSGGLTNAGAFDGENSPATLSANGMVDLTSGTWRNLGSTTFSLGSQSLLVVPSGFNPATALGGNSTFNIVYTLGTPLSVPAGKGCTVSGPLTVNDPVSCQGTMQMGTYVSLTGGLTLSGTGVVNVSGVVTNGCASTMTGGWLAATGQWVGNGGSGVFTQSGGTNCAQLSGTGLSGDLYLGYGTSDKGTYNLIGGSIGSGFMGLAFCYVGRSGTGNFFQSGGSNNGGYLYLAFNPGSTGTYSLSGGSCGETNEWVGAAGLGTFAQSGGTNAIGSALNMGTLDVGYGAAATGTYTLSGGQLSVTGTEYIGGTSYSGSTGAGTFTQSGGTNAAGALWLGYSTGSGGTYNLNGGTLIPSSLSGGSGAAVFNFGGGTVRASGSFSSMLPMTLTGTGGSATFDTAGYAMTLAGSLSGPGGLIKVDSGTLTLSASNTYGGGTTVNGGLLSLTGALNSAGPLAVGGGTFSYAPTAHGGTGNSQTAAGVTVNVGASTINASTGNALSLGLITRNTGGVVDFNSNTTGTITTTQASINGILGPWATYGGGTSMKYATATGSSALYTITAYAGATAITSGVTGLVDTTGAVNYALSGGGGTLATAVSANTLQFTGAANTITVSSANLLSLNGIVNVGSGTATIAGGNLIVGSTRELVVTGPGNVTVGAAIQDNASGASALTMTGGGKLLLSGANTYGGDTVVSGGTLKLGNAAALPQGINSGNLCLFGTLDLNNLSVNVNGLSGNGVVISNSPGNPTLTVGNNNATSAFSGVIQNGAAAVALAKTGSGALSLTGSGTYTGRTFVNAGSLIVNGSLAKTAVAVEGGATLGGTGSIGGSVMVAGGSGPSTWGTISLVDGAPGTLTLSDAISTDTVLTLGGSAAGNLSLLDFEVGATADRILIAAGKLVVNPGGGIINITPLAGFGPGTYDLLDFASG
jgi:autotransporter-associated beta strand protein